MIYLSNKQQVQRIREQKRKRLLISLEKHKIEKENKLILKMESKKYMARRKSMQNVPVQNKDIANIIKKRMAAKKGKLD